MTALAARRFAPALPAGPITRGEARWLLLILAIALAVRTLALLVLDEPLYSDSAAYMEMARTAIQAPVMRDIYGNAALYSPGYPLLLSAAFRLFGIDPAVARGVNLMLGLLTVALTWAVGRRATGRPLVGLLAAGGAALLIPAVASTELLERENLSVPLLMLFVYAVLRVPAARRPLAAVLAAGIVFGCGLMAGVSTLFTGATMVGAVALRRPGRRRGAGLLLAFAAATLLVLAPWLARNDRVVGRPVMGTNGGINLYVGNNPYANGYFVSIADTPIGPYWQTFRKLNGEARQSDELTAMALDHIASHPWDTLVLDLHKLVYFWLPDTPDPTDSDQGAAVSAARWAGAAQHIVILVLVGVGLLGWRRWPAGLWLIALAIGAFWSIHGIVYVITRYRAPAMPLMLVLAAVPVAETLARRVRRDTENRARLTRCLPRATLRR